MPAFPRLDEHAVVANSRGFLDNNSKEKNKDDLAAKITNIDGKVIGRRAVSGILLDTNVGDSVMDTTAARHSNSHVYVEGQPLKSILKSNLNKKRASNAVGDVPRVNVGKENNKEDGNGGIAGIASTSYTTNPKTQVDDVIKEGRSKAAGVSFASMFSEPVSENATAAKESVMSRYSNTLVGYFVGKSLAFQIVQNYVNNTWAKFGLSKLMKTDNGVFLFKFDTKSGMDQVIERGPWLIRNTPLILTKWTPNISLKPGVVTKVPVWVKLYNVLVVAYSEDGLSLIATQIGKPIMVDAFTSSMCVDSWGQISFARALIEIDANSDLKKEVKMAIPVDEDD
ncbi:putative reverse transcriptase domain, ribonuclease H-like domain, aspartic peptidase domain protein [Tanacetum coccineum]